MPSPASRSARRGFTLVELLVVIVIIAVLAAMLFPAIQQIRESARKNNCANNLRQIAVAVTNFEAQQKHYPSSWKSKLADGASSSDDIKGWSAQAQLLPLLDKKNLYDQINFNEAYDGGILVTTADGSDTLLSAMRVSTYLCPSEAKDESRNDSSGAAEHYPINYAMNLGDGFVFDPESNQGGHGAFYPNSKLRQSDMKDGMDTTICAAEVKGWTPYERNTAVDASTIQSAIHNVLPTELGGSNGTPESFMTAVHGSGTFKTNSGHTEWVDGRAHQTGFTSVFTPNTKVLHDEHDEHDEAFDIDWTNWQEGKGGLDNTNPTYAAVTARSYHPGGVNVVMMGTSVKFISDDINIGIWRALSTRNSKELIPADFDRE